MKEYITGEWKETRITVKVTDVNGGVVTETKSAGLHTYGMVSGMLYMSEWPANPSNYTVTQENGADIFKGCYGPGYSFRYVITIVSDNEMVWTNEYPQKGPVGVPNFTFVRKVFLSRKL